MAILAVNAGSSSLKFSLHAWDGGVDVGDTLLIGSVDGLEPQGQPRWRCRAPMPAGPVTKAAPAWRDLGAGALPSVDGDTANATPFARALAQVQALITQHAHVPVRAVSHRVVHGGAQYRHAVCVDDAAMQALHALDSLAPLHQPHNLAGIELFRSAWPDVPQVACFDTAFHATQPELEQRFALPEALHAQGVRRYGFHGLSYQFIAQALSRHTPRAAGRVLMAHLGNGASPCGAIDGTSRTSSMGFSALDGLMMGTRSGALDPGVLLWLMQQGWTHERIERLLYRESGLLGVSGQSADMRRLRQIATQADAGTPSDRDRAQLAIDLFTHRIVRECGAVAAVLQGLDVIAFSGGIGEHDAQLRRDVAQRLQWLGVQIDEAANRAAAGDAVRAIHTAGSAVELWVVPTDEGVVAAQEAARCLARAG